MDEVMDELERTLNEEMEQAEDLMWSDDDEGGPLNLNPLADDSAVSCSTRSHRPELLQGVP